MSQSEKETVVLHPSLHWQHFDCIDSTNAFLLRHRDRTNQLISADRQTAGRGRRQQQWIDEGDSLLFSLVTEFSVKQDVSAWPVQVAITLAQTLSDTTSQTLRIKWPNDLYTTGVDQSMGKCAGILVESSIGQSGRMITGVGINLSPIRCQVTTEYPIAYIDTPLDKKTLLLRLANALYLSWQTFFNHPGVNPDNFRPFDLLFNRSLIAFDSNTNKETVGTGQGINSAGQLLLLQQGNLTALTSQQRIRII